MTVATEELNPNDRFRALQIALIEMGTALAVEYGLDPLDVHLTISVRMPSPVEFIEVKFTTIDHADDDEEPSHGYWEAGDHG